VPLPAPHGEGAAQPGQPVTRGAGVIAGLPSLADTLPVLSQLSLMLQSLVPLTRRVAPTFLPEQVARMVG
jgi:hypothetical protein